MKPENHKVVSAVYITFSGNCNTALHFYQQCFGGLLQIATLDEELQGFPEMPVVSGSLVSEKIIIHGSDLVHEEGRKLGNHIAVFLHCENAQVRNALIDNLGSDKNNLITNMEDQKLIEVTDAFGVRWVLGV